MTSDFNCKSKFDHASNAVFRLRSSVQPIVYLIAVMGEVSPLSIRHYKEDCCNCNTVSVFAYFMVEREVAHFSGSQCRNLFFWWFMSLCLMSLYRFLPRDAIHSAVLSRHKSVRLFVRPSACLSVCLSVCHTRGLCPQDSTYESTIMISSQYGSPMIL